MLFLLVCFRSFQKRNKLQLLQDLSASLPIQLHVLSLSLKQHQNIKKYVLCWLTIPEHGMYHGLWWIYPILFHWQTLMFLLPAALICEQDPYLLQLLGARGTCECSNRMISFVISDEYV